MFTDEILISHLEGSGPFRMPETCCAPVLRAYPYSEIPAEKKQHILRTLHQGDFVSSGCQNVKALGLGDLKDSDKAVIYKNRSMCQLKLDKYEKAVADATESLELVPNDPKALYRRCLAYEKLDRLEEAYKDAGMLLKVEPKNVAVKPVLARLTPVKIQNSTQEKVRQMFNLAFDGGKDKEKRLQACNNLIVLAREDGGPSVIMEHGGMGKLKEFMLSEKDPDLLQAGTRVLSCLTQTSKDRSQWVYENLGVVRLGQLMAMPIEGLSTSVAHLIHNMLHSITDWADYQVKVEEFQEKKRNRDPAIHPKFKLEEYQHKFIDEVFHGLIKMLQHHKVSACGRDAAMELMIKTVPRKTGLQWTKKFLESDAIEGLLVIAGTVIQHQSIPVTEQSRMHASLLLNTIWEDLAGEKEAEKFKGKVSEFFTEMFANEDLDSKVEAVRAISMLLQGPFEIGNMILGFEGVTQIMLALAQSDRIMHQQIAVEAIVHSASKKDRCTGLLAEAVPVLKKLYHDGGDDNIKVRALVGMCKLGFLSNPDGNLQMKQWATEGLAYLTLDADVKEELVNDPQALDAVIQASANPSTSLMYAAAILFVNLTNSTDKQEVAPEMVELAKYAKQHIPEEHPKLLLALCQDNNTDLGKQVAAQTLAKLAITQDPQITFAGQKMYEVVRPLITLLHVIKTFEGENDRVKFFMLICGDEDEKIVRAASGALAVLTSESDIVCKKIVEVNKWDEILLALLVNELPDIQHRGCYIVRNMVHVSKEIAEKVFAGQVMEVMMALSILTEPAQQKVRELSKDALHVAEEHGIIKKNPNQS
ncbi:UN45B-like protein [Mya arenaria]|uniref:UN45B-like protein n=1 Tax=Mya arenaria TaxID=6604 RepID=A0ABY7F542_MYAAR|nr:UN45B-like protein [Mya arenaria]